MATQFKSVIALLAAVVVATTAACAGEPSEPTPNLDATVEARVHATIETILTATPIAAPLMSTLTPKATSRPTPRPEATLATVATATIQIVIEHSGLALDDLTQTRDIFGDQVFIGAVQNKTTGSLSGISVSLEF